MMDSKILRAVVVGNDHYNTLNVVRDLGRAGVAVDCVISSDKKHSFVLASKYVSDGHIVPENQDLADFLLHKYGGIKARIPLISTCDKIAEELDKRYDDLSELFYMPNVGRRQGGIQEAMNKNNQISEAKKAGFSVPVSVSVALGNPDRTVLSEMKYPCIIKPESSINGSKHDFRICNDEQELMATLKTLPESIGNVLVQQYIPNDKVLVQNGVRTYDGKNYMAGVIDKFKHGTKFHNLGLNSLGRLTDSHILDACCNKYLESINYSGLYSFDVVEHRDASGETGYYFMEINLRSDGLMFFYSAAGVNYPEIWVRSCLGLPIEKPNMKREVIGMNEFQYIRNYLRPSHLFTVVKDFMSANAFSIMSMRDFRPFISKLLHP